jgi:hypothetical protein
MCIYSSYHAQPGNYRLSIDTALGLTELTDHVIAEVFCQLRQYGLSIEAIGIVTWHNFDLPRMEKRIALVKRSLASYFDSSEVNAISSPEYLQKLVEKL